MLDRKELLPEVFADGVSQVSFSEVFRIILAGINPEKGQSEEGIPLTPKMTVLMPVNGFLQTFKAMKDVIDQMVEAGALDKEAVDAALSAAQAPGGNGNGVVADIAPPAAPRSSNFDD